MSRSAWLAGAGWAALVSAAWYSHGRTEATLDEAYTLTAASLPLGELGQVLVTRELNASLHTLLVWVLHLDEAPLVAARLLSTVCASAATAVLYAALRRYGAVPAVAGTFVVLVNPDVLYNVVNARGYTLALLLVAVQLALALRVADTGSRSAATWLGVVGGIALYAHFFTAPTLLVVLLWLWLRPGHDRRLWWRTAAPVAVLAVPLVWFLVSGGASQGQLPVGLAVSPRDYVSVVLAVLAGGARGRPWLQLLCVAVLALALLGGLRSARRPDWVLGVAGFGLLLLLAAAASIAEPSIFSPRYCPSGFRSSGWPSPRRCTATGRGAGRCSPSASS